jgi:hypothetical protein
MTADDDHRLSETDAAALLGVDPAQLALWREEGDAPPHHTDDSGRAMYRRQDVIDWRERFVVPPGDVDQGNGGQA